MLKIKRFLNNLINICLKSYYMKITALQHHHVMLKTLRWGHYLILLGDSTAYNIRFNGNRKAISNEKEQVYEYILK